MMNEGLKTKRVFAFLGACSIAIFALGVMFPQTFWSVNFLSFFSLPVQAFFFISALLLNFAGYYKFNLKSIEVTINN
jgi:hypothetical protein